MASMTTTTQGRVFLQFHSPSLCLSLGTITPSASTAPFSQSPRPHPHFKHTLYPHPLDMPSTSSIRRTARDHDDDGRRTPSNPVQ
ncbi:hypothetical protein FA13DRAFT_1324897 [Coprinellus micaceus]|uniref:Uncharacterized protein n=1 Tax=Coprinellus micaceus TaxID=71717 RepID=A0A4Y7SSQ7_COPMI|nr:hypothetical protein FA13DRAFT_1324897 [Coprinellus micaceus]